MFVVLDSGPIGLLTHPHKPPASVACALWVERLVRYRHTVCLPEICDYETRRDAIRRNAKDALAQLDNMAITLLYMPLTTEVMHRAAWLWAEARSHGLPTADRKSLDADVILAAQAQLLAEVTGERVVVATDNIRHLARFVEARSGQEIDG